MQIIIESVVIIVFDFLMIFVTWGITNTTSLIFVPGFVCWPSTGRCDICKKHIFSGKKNYQNH